MTAQNQRLTKRSGDSVKKSFQIPFAKLHGCGNDFIVSPIKGWTAGDRKKARTHTMLSRLAKSICERHTGIGADGFLLVEPPKNRAHHARIRFFNADGSEAEMSGNGIRCAGAFLMGSSSVKSPLRLETAAGVKTLELVKREPGMWVFRVSMGRPILEPQKIPLRAKGVDAPVVQYPLALRKGKVHVTVTSMGNPHCSLFVRSFDRISWPEVGREIEVHPVFPNRTNVEFVRVISKREIEVRYWERGVGITASSGTGSCAAAVASILNGFTDRRVRVKTVAGPLEVEWPEEGEVMLTGPAQWIAEGVYCHVM